MGIYGGAQRVNELERRVRAIERAARWPALLALLGLGVLAGALSGWAVWPWLYGLGTMAVLAIAGIRRRIGVVRTLLAGLVVTDIAALSYVDPWWWGALAGLLVTATGAAARRYWHSEWKWAAITAVVIGGALVLASAAVLSVRAAHRAEQARADEAKRHAYEVARMRPEQPHGVVYFLAEAIADRRPSDACFMLTTAAQRQFAAAHDAPDCRGAVQRLSNQVRERADYINNLFIPGSATTYARDRATVDACRLTFDALMDEDAHQHPGPQLGALTMRRQYNAGYVVTNYQGCH